MDKKYTYDAFISYRHCDLDQFVAENLHKQLEAYKLPARIAKKDALKKYKIERVFRDKEELPIATNLEDPIVEALKESEYLLVICTPRIKESIWCRKEIETFIKLHGRERILAILAEGEPADSFPEELLYRDKEITNDDGTVSVIREAIEPLGADVRGKDKKEVLKAIKAELPRILAPMFGTSYDGLRQRHRERRMKRIMAAALLTAAVGITFGTVSTIMATKIQRQKTQIEEQNTEITKQNSEIVKKNVEIQAQSAEIQKQNDALLLNKAVTMSEEALRMLNKGDRVGAVKMAKDALTESDGIKMPYTEEAVYALTTATRYFDRGNKLLPLYQTKFPGTVDWMEAQYKAPKVLVKDSVDHIYVVNAVDGKIEYTIEDSYFTKSPSAAFISDNEVAYINTDSALKVVNISTGADVAFDAPAWCNGLKVQYDWNVMVLESNDTLFFYDMNKRQEISRYVQGAYNFLGTGYFGEANGERYYAIQAYDKSDNDLDVIAKINIDTGTVSEISIAGKTLGDVKFTDTAMLVLTSEYKNNYMDCDLYLAAYDHRDNHRLWEICYENSSGYYMAYSEAYPDAVLVMAGWSVLVVDLKAGAIDGIYSIGDETTFAMSSADGSVYGLFTRDGKRKMLDLEGKNLVEYGDTYIPHSDNLKEMRQVKNGIMASAYRENAVTYYSILDYENPVSDITIPDNETVYYSFSEAKALAAERNLLYPEIANYVFFSDDEKLTFVSYADDAFRIYNTADSVLLQEISGESGIRYFYGTDPDGNYFVGTVSSGYKLSKDNKLMAYLPNFETYDAAKNVIILEQYGVRYEYPNLSTAELLDYAEKIVLKYSETN